jgi:bacteriocin biosynthesis cyclodehydratase domain-containing protein
VAALAYIGSFGGRVAATLNTQFPGAARQEIDIDSLEAMFSAGSSIVAIALWRPHAELCDRADDFSFRYGVPWLPIIMEHPVIRVGPLVRPGLRPCFRCYARRRAQHENEPWIGSLIEAAYARNPDSGPRGYLPYHVRSAAAVAARILRAQARGDTELPAQGVTTISLADSMLRVNPVIPCHDCRRCGVPATDAVPSWLTDTARMLPGNAVQPALALAQ